MKYFVLVTLIALIHWTNCENDYSDDAASYGYDPIEDRIDDTPKPTYMLSEAPSLFAKYIKDFNKKYKDEEDFQKHYYTFFENLKEINRINSDKESTFTSDINMFTDYSEEERRSLLGVGF
uniref:SFRICE_036048 n=1 Tax=Spodoptera frugiperda TaxID=7108 RepID=A0A2H1V5F8_SPOFR